MKPEPVPGIPGAHVIHPKVHADDRGSFLEIFREDLLGMKFVQANHSHSKQGVLRGLHWHKHQADAWYVIAGSAQAMLADLRTPSPHPMVASIELSAAEPTVLLIPPGVAHGFLALTDVDLIYWVTEYYDSSDEFGVSWDDPTLSAPWNTDSPILSERDQANSKLTWEAIDLS